MAQHRPLLDAGACTGWTWRSLTGTEDTVRSNMGLEALKGLDKVLHHNIKCSNVSFGTHDMGRWRPLQRSSPTRFTHAYISWHGPYSHFSVMGAEVHSWM